MSGAADWSQGYVTDTLYTENHYRELSPAWINYVAVLNGCQPRRTDRAFTYLELGCGHGRTLVHLAAAFPEGRFHGVDFNPAHIDSAQRYAAALGIGNVEFLECGFQDLAGAAGGGAVGGAGRRRAADLPDFDFIALHGVYSWISAEARLAVQRIIFETLKPGGLVYNSYNCLPGWASEAPIRRLFVEFAAIEPGSSTARMQKALKHAGDLQALKHGYLARNPAAAQAITQHLQRPANYMAHEYLNADWNPFYSIDVAAEMAATKLDFVGAAQLAENHLDLLLTDEAAAFVQAQPTLALRQLMQDFLVNQRFRRDVFVRGHARLGPADIAANLRHQCFLPMRPLTGLEAKIKVPRGDVTFDAAMPLALATAFADQALSFGDIAENFRKAGRRTTGLDRFVTILAAAGILAPAARAHQPAGSYEPPVRLELRLPANRHLLQQAVDRPAGSSTNALLVVPALGGVVPISRGNALLLNEMLLGGTKEELVERGLAALDRSGLAITQDGQQVTDPEARRGQLAEMIQNFRDGDLALLLRGGAVDVN